MAFTSIAALVGGSAASATLVLGAIAEVGMAMSVVGAVTGNKKLMKVGGVLGLVGGVGGMIARAGTAAAGAAAGAGAGEVAGLEQLGEAGGYGFTSAETGLQTLGEAGGYAVEGVSGGMDASQMASEALQELGEGQWAQPGLEPGMEPNALKELGAGPELPKPEVTVDPVKPPEPSLIGKPPADPTANTPQQAFRSSEIAAQNAGAGTLPGTTATDYFKNFLKFVEDNKEFSKMAFEGLKGMAGSELEDAKTDYYKAEAGRYKYGNTVARYQPLIGAA